MGILKSVARDAGAPLKSVCGQNDFSCFDCVAGKTGVYVFQDRDTGTVLYAGQSEDLGYRVSQYYNPRDTTGGFGKNWRRENCARCKDKKACSGGEDCNFDSYKDLLRSAQVVFFYSEDGDVTKEKIDALEAFLLLSLRPRYDGRSMQMRLGRISEITDDEILDFVVSQDDNESIVGAGSKRRVHIDSATCGGRPRIRGTRIRVSDILDHLANSVSQAEILADFPDLREEDLKAALAFGARASDRSGAASG